MSEEYLDAMSESRKDLVNACCELNHLVRSLYGVGNTFLAGRIEKVAESIEMASKRIDSAQRKESNRLFEQAEQSSLNVLHATLAGIDIGSGGER